MRSVVILLLIMLFSAGWVCAQSKSNDAINKQIKDLKAGKTFTLTYDKSSDMSKLMATSESFSDADSKKAGIQAMSFGMAYFWQGQALTKSADSIAITFWVMSKKPQFASSHKWIVIFGKDPVDYGDGQYAARANENMEYLNYKISRQDLASTSSGTEFTIGNAKFTFMPEHLKLFKDILKLTDPAQ